MPMTSREMIKLLRENGFIIINQTGSHVKLRNYISGRQVIVPFHSKTLKKGLEHAILKQAGLSL
ncbi:MAG TPA: type II toxin-antitoxin system HicA family toxin [Candidatus Avilachnospira avicola]|nr:type II toxin-antitoxin system HicA family toxin [Candidatus Avilachnospira avicola]